MIDLFRDLTDYEREDLNTIELNGREYRAGEVDGTELIIAAAFGADTHEDSYNSRIADAVEDLLQKSQEADVIVQSEVADILEGRGYEEIHSVGESYEEDDNTLMVSKYTTSEIFEESHEIALENNYDAGNTAYIGHPAHMKRIENVAENIGFEGEPVLPKVEWPEDSQPWVNSELRWVPREVAARLYNKLT